MPHELSSRAAILAQRAHLLTTKDLAALILIGAWNGRFGRVRLAETLAGDLSEKVGSAWLRKMPQFGVARVGGLPLAYEILTGLERAGLIATTWKGQTYPLVVLTQRGVDALRATRRDTPWQGCVDGPRRSGAGR